VTQFIKPLCVVCLIHGREQESYICIQTDDMKVQYTIHLFLTITEEWQNKTSNLWNMSHFLKFLYCRTNAILMNIWMHMYNVCFTTMHMYNVCFTTMHVYNVCFTTMHVYNVCFTTMHMYNVCFTTMHVYNVCFTTMHVYNVCFTTSISKTHFIQLKWDAWLKYKISLCFQHNFHYIWKILHTYIIQSVTLNRL